MGVEVNWLAVVLATASSMVVGFVWYAKNVFGNTWMKLTKLDEKKMNESAGPAIGFTIVASFVTAYVLAHVSFLAHSFFQNSFFYDAVMTSFWLWLGFTAARLLVHDLFERRPIRLTVLNAAHELVTLVVMGVIIGWCGV